MLRWLVHVEPAPVTLQSSTAVFIYLIMLTDAMFEDPVCNMMVDENRTKFVSEAGGKKVYLCSSTCKSEFDSNPSKFGY
jgi:YHS domain-containing protein